MNKIKPSYRYMTASKQQTIADTARRLFREHGFSAVSVGGICAEGRRQPRYLYKYYSGKNALYRKSLPNRKTASVPDFENLLARQCSLREAAEAVLLCNGGRSTSFIPPPSCATSKRIPIWNWAVFPRIERRKIRLYARLLSPCNNAA